MYRPGTILAPRDETKMRMLVIGPSPVSAMQTADWEGGGGEAVVVTSADTFTTNIVMPMSYAHMHYTVEFEPPMPEPLKFEQPTAAAHMPTPEQIFAANAAEQARQEAVVAVVEAEGEALAEAAVAEPQRRKPGRPRKDPS